MEITIHILMKKRRMKRKVNQIAISLFHQFKNSKAKSEYDD